MLLIGRSPIQDASMIFFPSVVSFGLIPAIFILIEMFPGPPGLSHGLSDRGMGDVVPLQLLIALIA